MLQWWNGRHSHIYNYKVINNMKIDHHFDKLTNMYICDCGKSYNSRKSLSGHATHCTEYIKSDKKSKYKMDDKYQCECGYITDNSQSICAHFSHCDFHHKVNGSTKKVREFIKNKKMAGWDTKSTEELSKIHKKAGNTTHIKYATGELTPSFIGKNHTNQTKQKIRESHAKRKRATDRYTNYSTKGCEYIDKLNEKNNWNLQHAENGGETIVGGYYLDGYDKELNIAFEYDERKHYKNYEKNILKDKDVDRQNYIIELLNCTFYRYNEAIDLLYKVN